MKLTATIVNFGTCTVLALYLLSWASTVITSL
ncbi:hypothetical protein VPHK45_0072 [Vibrio phage K45]